MIHLRFDEARLYAGAVTCSCGATDCTRWREEAHRVMNGAFSVLARDLRQMAARKAAFEREAGRA